METEAGLFNGRIAALSREVAHYKVMDSEFQEWVQLCPWEQP